MPGTRDDRIRLAAFQFLDGETARRGEVLPRAVLEQGFVYEDQQIPLISPQGIFTPRGMECPLTICTVPPTLRKPPPYKDEISEDGLILYRYRGTDPKHRDNAGLRRAMIEKRPLAYLYGIVPGQYMPIWPVFIVGDDPQRLAFSVAVDEVSASISVAAEPGGEFKRRYITIETQRRLHQAGFRERVLRAYRDCCAVCRLRHRELLEAAHILSDKDPRGEPTISNGIALCKLHHAAFDNNIIGIRPDCIIEVREDVRRESDGPLLLHGLQEMHGQQLHLPHQPAFKPRTDFLEIRYTEFRKAG